MTRMSVSTERHEDELAAVRDEPSPVRGISRNVWILALVSLCTDVSSEMIYPLVPLFLTGVLGAPATVVGLIEGLAEATANLLKLVSGRVTDRHGRHKAWVYAGYGLSALSKPLLALATVWPLVLGARLVDRAGKGTRTTPRDALIAASSDPAQRGRSFGFHRSLDTFGAVVGPLTGFALLIWSAQNFRLVFALAAIPAVVGVLLIGQVREPQRRREDASFSVRATATFTWRGATGPYRLFLAIGLLFALGNSSQRGGALGLYTAATGLMALVSSVLAGLLWDHVAPAAPFYLGGVTALCAAVGLLVLVPRRVTARRD